MERALASGELMDSELGPLVLKTLQQETDVELAKPYDPRWITAGIRVADFYYRLIRSSAGVRDWQRDLAKTATPILVGVVRSLVRSPDAQAVMVRLCESVAGRLRLTLVWPDTALVPGSGPVAGSSATPSPFGSGKSSSAVPIPDCAAAGSCGSG
jgi:hypothetical protein